MSTVAQPRTYEVKTYGCQMNVHDSERLSGLLEDAGYARVPAGEQADVVVFNTCAVRENADNKLYGNLGHLAPVKAEHPGMQIAVGGCLAQKDRDTITLESLDVFPSTLPTKRESAYAAWVSVSVGCNNTCTFCIVPALRGKEKDRRPGEILAEMEALVAEGVSEITLLGQNVNAYGVEFGDRQAFSKLLRACGEIEGLERVRFTSPHPAEFTDDVIDAMAETPNVMPSLHMPLQSGSDKVLKDMRRSYRSAKYLGILERVREQIPHAAITTDIIVGFPGETEEDFLETMRVVRESRFASAFTFQYSKRPGTPAADLDVGGWVSHQWVHLVRSLPADADQALLDDVDAAFGFSTTGNIEVATAWFELAVSSGWVFERPAADEALGDLLTRHGRALYLRKVYTRLAATERGKERAREIYAVARPTYHPVSQGVVDRILA